MGLSLMRMSKCRRQEENVVCGANERSQKVIDREPPDDALSCTTSVLERCSSSQIEGLKEAQPIPS